MIKYFIFIFLIISPLIANKLFLPLEEYKIINKELVVLGEELFFDKNLSKDKNISCFSCHSVYGADNKNFSLGVYGKKGNMNTLSIFNSVYNFSFFWNGKADSLKEQIIGPLTNKHEMNISKEEIEKILNSSPKYISLFKKVFNKKPSYEKMIDSIIEFEKTLITVNSKFDKYLRGEINLSKEENKGLQLFQNYGCVTCHNGVNIGGNSFQKFGSVIYYKNYGKKVSDRYSYTLDKEDINVYRVPSLRNVEKTSPYFHSGFVKSLKEAINIMAYYNLGKTLNDDEINAIESFLKTLTGELPESYKKRLIK